MYTAEAASNRFPSLKRTSVDQGEEFRGGNKVKEDEKFKRKYVT